MFYSDINLSTYDEIDKLIKNFKKIVYLHTIFSIINKDFFYCNQIYESIDCQNYKQIKSNILLKDQNSFINLI